MANLNKAKSDKIFDFQIIKEFLVIKSLLAVIGFVQVTFTSAKINKNRCVILLHQIWLHNKTFSGTEQIKYFAKEISRN